MPGFCILEYQLVTYVCILNISLLAVTNIVQDVMPTVTQLQDSTADYSVYVTFIVKLILDLYCSCRISTGVMLSATPIYSFDRGI